MQKTLWNLADPEQPDTSFEVTQFPVSISKGLHTIKLLYLFSFFLSHPHLLSTRLVDKIFWSVSESQDFQLYFQIVKDMIFYCYPLFLNTWGS